MLLCERKIGTRRLFVYVQLNVCLYAVSSIRPSLDATKVVKFITQIQFNDHKSH